MPIDRMAQRLKSRQQMILALELKLTGATYEQIGKSLSPPVSRQRAFKIVQKALDERVKDCQEVAEKARLIEVARIDRWMFALEPKKTDPRVVDTLLRLSESRRKLLGLDAPQRIAQTLPDGSPIPTPVGPDYDNLTLEELQDLKRLHLKLSGSGEEGKPQ